MEEKLKEFQNKKKLITPTSSLMNDVNDTKLNEKEATLIHETGKKQKINKLSDLFSDKKRMEDTHTRRTFLIRNDLLERLDDTTNKPENFTKTKFINYLLEKGLDQLEKEVKRIGQE